MVKFWFLSAGIFGFLSVALGAFGAHSLKNVLDEYGKSIYEKAVLYQMFHAAALFAVGMIQHFDKETSFSLAGWGFLVGIILFSGTLYLWRYRVKMARSHHAHRRSGLSFWVVLAGMVHHQRTLLILVHGN
jgi:uncharacterized membrane protein YgdD (TMEM256/DUF423 family)